MNIKASVNALLQGAGVHCSFDGPIYFCCVRFGSVSLVPNMMIEQAVGLGLRKSIEQRCSLFFSKLSDEAVEAGQPKKRFHPFGGGRINCVTAVLAAFDIISCRDQSFRKRLRLAEATAQRLSTSLNGVVWDYQQGF